MYTWLYDNTFLSIIYYLWNLVLDDIIHLLTEGQALI